MSLANFNGFMTGLILLSRAFVETEASWLVTSDKIDVAVATGSVETTCVVIFSTVGRVPIACLNKLDDKGVVFLSFGLLSAIVAATCKLLSAGVVSNNIMLATVACVESVVSGMFDAMLMSGRGEGSSLASAPVESVAPGMLDTMLVSATCVGSTLAIAVELLSGLPGIAPVESVTQEKWKSEDVDYPRLDNK